MKLATAIFALVLCGYIAVFSFQEQNTERMAPVLTSPLPAIVQQAALGFFRQLGAEMLFVKCAVFSGNRLSSAEMADNADSFSLNLDAATLLYPEFVDPYYFAQATLPHISPHYAAITNDLLARYAKSGQQDIIIPFFRGFNFFYYMHENQLASDVFDRLSHRDDAPSWFGHFAGILSARGGNLYVGLVGLQSMLAVETDEAMQKRYRDDIEVFKQAIVVQKATQNYYDSYGAYPIILNDLIPEFLTELPVFSSFELRWHPPVLKLDHPERK